MNEIPLVFWSAYALCLALLGLSAFTYALFKGVASVMNAENEKKFLNHMTTTNKIIGVKK